MTRNGFTLVELLVALVIFGLLSAAGVALLSFSVTAQDNSAARMDEVSALRRVGALLTGDLAQAVPRVTRDEAGQSHAAFEGGARGVLLSFTRAGWDNPDAEPRPSLQKVEYRLAGNRLERVAYPLLDGARPLAPAEVMNDVQGARLRFRDASGAWLDRWVAARATDMPRAVELELDSVRYGRIRQLFLVGGGG